MQQKEAVELLLSDRMMFLETLVRIEDKQRTLVPFKLNDIQRNILEASTGRDVYVKPSQVGASSIFIADFLIDCLTIEGTVAIIISYDEFITGRLLRKAQQFYNFLKELIPTIDEMEHKSTYEKTFKKMGSSFYICSAGARAFGRGETIHDLLIDEYAFWPEEATGEKLFTSAIQRVPLTENTKIRFCSTPNGEDNDFCEMYHCAKEGRRHGASVYQAHFYPWFLHAEYVMDARNPFVLPGDDVIILKNLDPDETNLLKVFEKMGFSELDSYDKIRWRRYKIAEMSSARRSGETRLLFSQEYPENDVDCFLQAGDQVYPPEVINEMSRGCFPALSHHLWADIWISPEPDKKYLIAIDPGEGKVSESVATVWRLDNPNSDDEKLVHCATLAGFFNQPDMAEKVMDLGRYYNTAILAPEDALDFVSYIKDYPELYYMTDPTTDRILNTVGWRTTKATKPYMIAETLKFLHKIETHDIRIVSQFRNIRWILGRDGKERAMAIGADDYHDSTAIAVVCRQSMPIERGFVGTCGWNEKWGR
jgi:hypothetical protein